MSKLNLTSAALAALLLPAQALAGPIAGKWRTDDGKAIVTIERCGNALCGDISRFLVAEPAGGVRDRENPNEDLRDRKLLGARVFWGLKQAGDVWKGKGYNPEDGRYFDAELDARGNKLKIKGCVFLFCKSKVWTPG